MVGQGRVSENAYIRTRIQGHRDDTPHTTQGETELRPLSRARRVAGLLKPAGWQLPSPSCYLLPVETQWSFTGMKNDSTHDNLDGGFKSSFPLTGIAIPMFNNGANGFPCPFF